MGERLKIIDQQLKSVTEEYSDIHDMIGLLKTDIGKLGERQAEISDTVRRVVREETDSLQNRWLLGTGSLIAGAGGMALAITSNDAAIQWLQSYGTAVGLTLFVLSGLAMYSVARQR